MLTIIADIRGFMTAHGAPDEARAARLVLKDYVGVLPSLLRARCSLWSSKGKLLYCHSPPDSAESVSATPSAADAASNVDFHNEAHAQHEKELLARPAKKNLAPTIRPQGDALLQSYARQDQVTAQVSGRKHKQSAFTRVQRPYSAVPLKKPAAPTAARSPAASAPKAPAAAAAAAASASAPKPTPPTSGPSLS